MPRHTRKAKAVSPRARKGKLERCVLSQKRKGRGKTSAFKICNASIPKGRKM